MPTTQEDTEAVVVQSGFNRYNTTTTHRTRSRDIATINGTQQLEINPNLTTCHWMWLDIQAVDTLFRDGCGTTLWDEELYLPTNPSDPTSNWGKVIGPNDNPYCGTYSPPATCVAGPDCYTMIELIPTRITITDAPNQYYDLDADGTMYWILGIYTLIARGGSNARGSITTSDIQGDGTLICKASPVGYSFRAPIVTLDLSTGSTSIPPYRYNAASASFMDAGGRIATYGKAIDCDNDFSGSPVTLSLMGRNASEVARATFFDVTAPSTVDITYAV